MNIDVEIDFHGPIFTAAANAIVRDGISDIMERVTDFAEDEVRGAEGMMQAPTGTWAGGIDTDSGALEATVHPNRGLPYNHWLEGVGSRNGSSSFKGYRMWREAHAATQHRADLLTAEGARKMIARLNG